MAIKNKTDKDIAKEVLAERENAKEFARKMLWEREGKQITSDISKSISDYETALKQYRTDYSARFGAESGYRADATDAMKKAWADKSKLEILEKKARAKIDEWKDFLGNDYVKSLDTYFYQNNQLNQDILGSYKLDADYMSKFNDESEYTASKNWQNKLKTADISKEESELDKLEKELESRKNRELTEEYVLQFHEDMKENPRAAMSSYIYSPEGMASNKAGDVNEKRVEELKKLISEKKNFLLSAKESQIINSPDFAERSSNRSNSNPSKEELEYYDQFLANGITYDANGTARDYLGNKLDLNNLPQKPSVEDKLGMFLNASDEERKAAQDTPISQAYGYTKIIKDGYDKSWDKLTEDEIGVYYVIRAEEGQAAAEEYLENKTIDLNQRSVNDYYTAYENASKAGKVAANVAAPLARVFAGGVGFVEDAVNVMSGKDINPYSKAHSASNWASSVTESTAQAISEATEGVELFGQNIPAFLYQTSQSMIESGAAALIPGGFASLGMNAATSEAKRLFEQGASNEQVFLGGLLAGIAESVFEKVSIENLVKPKDMYTKIDLVKEILKQGGVEASEEVATEIANKFTNYLVMGKDSDWQKAVDEEGLAMAFIDAFADVAWAGAGGFISGAGMGGVRNTSQYISDSINDKKVGQQIKDAGAVQELIDAGKSMPLDSRSFEMAQMTSEDVKSRNVGRLSRALSNEMTEETVDHVDEAKRSFDEVIDKSDMSDESKDQAKRMYRTPEGVDAGSEEGVRHAKEFAEDFQMAVMAGRESQRTGEDIPDLIENGYVTTMTGSQVDTAINMGRIEALENQQQTEAKKERFNKMISRSIEEMRAETNADTTLSPIQKAAARVAEALNTAVGFYNSAELFDDQRDGFKAKNGIIYLDRNTVDPIRQVFVHELAHFSEGSKSYGKLYNSIVNSTIFEKWIAGKKVAGKDKLTRMDNYLSDIEARYANAGESLTTDGAKAEMVANFLGEHFESEERFNHLLKSFNVQEKKTFLQKIGDLIQKIKNALTGKAMPRELRDIERWYQKALKESAAETKKETEGKTELSFSIKYNAVKINSKLYELIKNVIQGNFKSNDKVYLGIVSQENANKIFKLTGVDVTGFRIAIEARQIEHIIKDHGENGKADRSLADYENIAKMQYVLENPDEMSAAGKTQAYTQMKNGKNKTADTVLYEKRIGENSYYVVQAVPDTKAKTLYVVTAFIGKPGYKKEASQLINEKNLDATSKNGSVNASKSSISEIGEKVKTESFSIPEETSYSEYDKPITVEDVQALRAIGRKSINEFTDSDIKASAKWAHKFYQELGTKSPFFRAWFGDWRAFDTKKINTISISSIDLKTAIENMTTGTFSNVDAGWNISVGALGKNDTYSHSGGARVSVKMLSEIKAIVENAVLLDTEVSIKDSSKKHNETTFMHKLYAPVDYNGIRYIAKVSVEEYGIKNEGRRFYNLRGIKIELADGIPDVKTSYDTVSDTSSTNSISDLFKLVKKYDKEFKPNSVNAALLNEDGSSKVFYHGTDKRFTTFDVNEMAAREGSFFFAENRDDAAAYGKYVMPVYVTGKKIADYDNQPSEFYRLKDKSAQVKWLKERGYDGWYADMDSDGWGEVSVFSPEQIKSAENNIGTFNKYDADTQFSIPEKASAPLKNLVAREKSKSERTNKRVFSYNELVAKSDLKGNIVSSDLNIKYKSDGTIDTSWLLEQVRNKCQSIVTINSNRTYYVKISDINENVEVSREGILHGINRKNKINSNGTVAQNVKTNAMVAYDIPNALSNSIEVNRLKPRGNIDVPYSRVLVGVTGIKQKNGSVDYYAVRFVVEERVNQPSLLVESNILGKLYSVNAKKIDAAHARDANKNVALTTQNQFCYSVSDLLKDVKNVFNNTFSEDVYQRLGITRISDDFSADLQFSISEAYTSEERSSREKLAGALESVAKTEAERELIENYKKNVSVLETYEEQLRELKDARIDLSFSEGPRNVKRLNELNAEIERLTEMISRQDRRLLKLEASAPLKNLVARARKEVEDLKFSIPEKVEAKRSTNVDSYTEKQYNSFGWASYNGFINAKEREQAFSNFADYKKHGFKFRETERGEAVFPVGDGEATILFIDKKSSLIYPNITRVVKIDSGIDIYNTELSKEIFGYDGRQKTVSNQTVSDYIRYGFFTQYTKRDGSSFSEYTERRKNARSNQKSDTVGTEQQDGRRSDRSGENNRGRNEIESFSIPETLADEERSSREELAGALETVAKTEAERELIENYKKNVSVLETYEEQLRELKDARIDLSFSEGPRNVNRLNELNAEIERLTEMISRQDRRLLKLEASAPLKNLVSRARNEGVDERSASGRVFTQQYMDETLQSFGITTPKDYIHVQRQVLATLESEGFFTNKEKRSRVDINEASGMAIETNKSSIDETFNYHNYATIGINKKIAKLATIRLIPQIIKNGTLVKDNVPNQYKDSENKTFAYIESKVSVDGKEIQLKLDIKQSPRKNKFWVHKIMSIEKVSSFPASTENVLRQGKTTADTSSISQSDENVNEKFSIPEKAEAKRNTNVDSYTEKQYNSFGWASYNKHITAKEREQAFSNFADYKKHGFKFRETDRGEVVFPVGESETTIVFIDQKSTLKYPVITKVLKANTGNEYLDRVYIEELFKNNGKPREVLSNVVINDFVEQGIFDRYTLRNSASYGEYSEKQKRTSGNQSYSSRGGKQYGTRSNSNSENNRGHNDEIESYSIPERTKRLQQDFVDLYTEKQYNNFGWASYNGFINAKEREQAFSNFADYKKRGFKFRETDRGEAVFPVGEGEATILFIDKKSSLLYPNITRVVKIDSGNNTLDKIISEELFKYVYVKGGTQKIFQQTIDDYYREGLFEQYTKRDGSSFSEYTERRKNARSNKTSDSFGRGKQYGTRSNSNSENNRGHNDEIESYSIPERTKKIRQDFVDGKISYAELVEGEAELIEEARTVYGTIEQGENAVNKTPIPKAVEDGRLVGIFVRTITEKGSVDTDLANAMGEKVLLGEMSHDIASDEEALSEADKAIRTGRAEARWHTVSESVSKLPTKNDIAIGERLLAEAMNKGETADALNIASDLVDVFTRAGQAVQAARLLKKMTGVGRLVHLQRTVNKINEDINRRLKGKYDEISIGENLARELVEAGTFEEADEIAKEIEQQIAEQIPVTFLDKWNAWRYLSMLGNPLTHFRNLWGNAIFIPSVVLKRTIATGLERLIKPEQRTRALKVEQKYKDFAKEDLKNPDVQDLLDGTDKMTGESKAMRDRRIFKNKVLHATSTFNKNALSAEDGLFKGWYYKTALAGYLQTRNIDIDNISESDLMQARSFAVTEALKGTYNDVSQIALVIKKLEKRNTLVSILVNGVVPFKQTPINIVKRGVEYSPLGLMNSLTFGLSRLKKGEINASEFIDGVSAGASGTVVFAVGMLLSSLGWVTGGFGDDDEDKFRQLAGEQEYSLQAFGKSYSLDWAAPISIPFFIGVELVNSIRKEDAGFTLQDFTEVFWNSLDPIVNMSMLSGIENVISSVRNADGAQLVGTTLESLVTSYFGQAVPSLMGKFANVTDDLRRSNYIDKNSQIPSFLQRMFNSAISKIPRVSMLRNEYIDAWGRSVSQGNVIERTAEAFISPGYFNSIEYTDVDLKLTEIYEATGNTDIFPDSAKKYFSVNGERKDLTAKEYEAYAKAKGGYSFEYVKEFFDSEYANELTPEEQAKVIKKLYEYADEKAKADVSEYDVEKNNKTAYNIDEAGESVVDYFASNVESERYAPKLFNEALEEGDTSEIDELREDIVEYKTEQGKTEKEALSALKSSVTSYWKPLYIEAWENGYSDEMQRIQKALLDSGLYGSEYKVKSVVREWYSDYKKNK